MVGDVERFIAYKQARGKFTRSSAESKGSVLAKFAEWVEGTPTASITNSTVQAWYDKKCTKLKPSTVNSYLMMLSSFFEWAVNVEKIARTNPCKGIEMVEGGAAARPSFCTRKQRDKLIDSCQREDLKFVLFCGFHAGMRFQEIVEAKAFWFDLDGKMVHLRKTETMEFKDREERSLPMTKAFHAFLLKYGLREPFMLRPEVKQGKDIYRWNFKRPFAEHAAACGLPWVTPHVMRHTFASLLASAGASIYLISEWMGDDVKTVQKHYARLLPLHGEIEKAFKPEAPRASSARKPRQGRSGRKGSACAPRGKA